MLTGKRPMAADLAPPPASVAGDSRSRQPMVSIALVSTNEAHNIVGCLTSLAASTHDNFRVVICENGGEEGFQSTTRALAESCILRPVMPAGAGGTAVSPESCAAFELMPGSQRVTVLRAPRNLGYAGGVNACIAVTA